MSYQGESLAIKSQLTSDFILESTVILSNASTHNRTGHLSKSQSLRFVDEDPKLATTAIEKKKKKKKEDVSKPYSP